MYASVGDRLILHASRAGVRLREGEILDVRHPDGSPPYLVRWSDTGDEALVFPGADGEVQHVAPDLRPDPGDDAG